MASAATAPAVPCIECRTTGGWVPPHGVRPRRTRGYCESCYARHKHRRDIPFGLATGPPYREHPVALPAVVTIAMLDIDPADVTARCAAAADRLADEIDRAAQAGYRWCFQRPEQFTAAALAKLFPAGALAASFFATIAAEEAA